MIMFFAVYTLAYVHRNFFTETMLDSVLILIYKKHIFENMLLEFCYLPPKILSVACPHQSILYLFEKTLK